MGQAYQGGKARPGGPGCANQLWQEQAANQKRWHRQEPIWSVRPWRTAHKKRAAVFRPAVRKTFRPVAVVAPLADVALQFRCGSRLVRNACTCMPGMWLGKAAYIMLLISASDMHNSTQYARLPNTGIERADGQSLASFKARPF
eukprot:365288-Chlamydomonas_euryale.AAC.3